MQQQDQIDAVLSPPKKMEPHEMQAAGIRTFDQLPLSVQKFLIDQKNKPAN